MNVLTVLAARKTEGGKDAVAFNSSESHGIHRREVCQESRLPEWNSDLFRFRRHLAVSGLIAESEKLVTSGIGPRETANDQEVGHAKWNAVSSQVTGRAEC